MYKIVFSYGVEYNINSILYVGLEPSAIGK